jgi:NAD(P)-dependent dehydrogenase (short-subunit alcohol dehydrogenase family)
MNILITGSTDGLGKQLARELAARGAPVLVHGRSRERVDAVLGELGQGARGYVADLSSLAEVHRLAEAVPPVEVLVNNAGIFGTPSGGRELSRDGHELHFAVNYLAGFLLTGLLFRRSPPERVVNVSSGAQERIDFSDLMLERGYSHMRAYSRSKLAQVMFTFELAERCGGVLIANCLHPASLMDTKMVRRAFGRTLTPVEEGAEAVLRAIERDDVSGRYFEGLREARAHRQAYDPKARRRLWELSAELAGVRVEPCAG